MFRNHPVVIRFDKPLRAIIEGSVADGNSQAARRQVLPMDGADAVDHHGKTQSVFWTAPRRPFEADSRRGGAIHVGKFISLILAVVPSQARESSEVLADLLLQI